MKLELSLLQAVDTTFGPDDGFNVTVFAGSRFECSGCTLSVPSNPTAGRDNVLAFTSAQVLLNDCTLTNGGINAGNSSVVVNDSTVEAFAPGGATLTLVGASTANLTRAQLTGPVRVFQGSNALLGGVTQTPGAFTNQVDEASFVRVGDAPPAAGGPPSIPSSLAGFTLRNFAKASLTQTTTVAGGLNCGSGADAFCQTPVQLRPVPETLKRVRARTRKETMDDERGTMNRRRTAFGSPSRVTTSALVQTPAPAVGLPP